MKERDFGMWRKVKKRVLWCINCRKLTRHIIIDPKKSKCTKCGRKYP